MGENYELINALTRLTKTYQTRKLMGYFKRAKRHYGMKEKYVTSI
jgi:hypothetical protein